MNLPTESSSPTAEGEKHTLKKAALIVNTKSRQGKAAYRSVLEALQSRFDLVEAHAVKNPESVPALVANAVKSGLPLVIVGGGDGTLSACVQPFIGSDSVMGTLPMGTGNQFIRDLGLPNKPVEACIALAEGKIAAVDVGVINGSPLLTVATIGVTTRIARELTTDAKRKWGRFVYVLALLPALRKARPFEISIKADGNTTVFKSLQAVIGNGRYHCGPFPLSPDATITDGKFVVYALDGVSKWDLIRFALHLPGGNHVHMQQIHTFETAEGEISASPIQRVTIDGETHLKTPVHFKVLPGALRVIVPLNFKL